MSTVFITDGNGPLGAAMGRALRELGNIVISCGADLTVGDLERAISGAGDIGVLINNAEPEFERLAFEEVGEPKLASMISHVAKSAFFATKAVVPGMKSRGGGRIINVSSAAPVRGMTGGSHYTAAKGALYSLTRSWAMEFAPHGITVNLVAADVGSGTAAEDGGGATPLGRPVTLPDVVDAVAFLAGPGSGMITGQEIIINGGFTLQGF